MMEAAKARETPMSCAPLTSVEIGYIIAVTGSTNKRLKMLEPIMFPTHRSASFLIAAIIEVTSSGRLVPIATRAIPTMVGEIPRMLARATPFVITISPPTASPREPSKTVSQLNVRPDQKDLASRFSEL